MASPSQSPEFIRHIVETYRDDFNGYRRDILQMEGADWQDQVGNSLVENKRTSVAAGHGIGKTGLGAAAIHWFISTRPHPAIVATANTETQLRTKLWRELAKLNRSAANNDWFEWRTSTFTMFNDPTAQAQAISWSEDNPEAFAGTHEKHVLGLFDEASAIARVIFNVFSGAMTTAGARWLLLGNSTRNEGYFYDATHGKLVARKPGDLARGLWKSFVVPSWESPFVQPSWVEEMRSTLGEDSDEFRMRVAGLPPRFDAEQFIPREYVTKAMERTIPLFNRWPLVLGVDVGHTNDRSTIVPRRGKKVLPKIEVIRGERTTDFARRIAEEIRFYREEHGLKAQAVIEAIGMGVGVVETLEDMGYHEQVWGVNTGTRANEPELYTNLRCEMWGRMKEWLEGDVEMPNHPELNDDLTTLKRKPNGISSALRLESKDEMRRRGVKSPDVGDALALTFAVEFELLPDRRERDRYDQPEGVGGTWMSM